MQVARCPSFYRFSKCILPTGNNFRFSKCTFIKPYHTANCIRNVASQIAQRKPVNLLLVSKPNTLIALQYNPSNSLKLFVRNSSSESKEFCGQKTLDRYYRRNGLPRSYELIYRSNFPDFLLITQVGVFLTVLALIVTGVMFMLSPPLTEEDEVRRKEAITKKFEDKRKKDMESEFGKAVAQIRAEKGLEDPTGKGKPQLEDLMEGGPTLFFTFIGIIIFFAAALFRLQQLLPVRIYLNNKKHSVAVYYGHVVPGMLTHHEFVAGTVRPAKSRWESADTLFKDGSGKKMILFERFFRHPGDYNKIMGFDEEFMEEITKQRLRNPNRVTRSNDPSDDKNNE